MSVHLEHALSYTHHQALQSVANKVTLVSRGIPALPETIISVAVVQTLT